MSGDEVYRERAALVAHLTRLYPSVIAPAADVDEPGWSLVYIATPAGQLSWHIAPDDRDLFADVEQVPANDPRAVWDGHTTAAKYARLAALPFNLPLSGALPSGVSTVKVRGTVHVYPDPPAVAAAIRRARKGH